MTEETALDLNTDEGYLAERERTAKLTKAELMELFLNKEGMARFDAISDEEWAAAEEADREAEKAKGEEAA